MDDADNKLSPNGTNVKTNEHNGREAFVFVVLSVRLSAEKW